MSVSRNYSKLMISQLCSWRRQQPQGSPKPFCEYPDGARVAGGTKNGKLEGFCKVHYPNGDRYQGDFVDGLREGKGKMYYFKGELYNGEWHHNERHGTGQYFYENGERYQGGFRNNLMHGNGTFFLFDGSYFEGEFKENEKHGDGISYEAKTGRKFVQKWINGQLVQRFESQGAQPSFLVAPPMVLLVNSERYSSSDSESEFGVISCRNRGLQSEEELPTRVGPAFDVQEWLRNLGMNRYMAAFKENHIDSTNLLLLKDKELVELGVGIIGHRKLILREIEQLKKKSKLLVVRSMERCDSPLKSFAPVSEERSSPLQSEHQGQPPSEKEDESSSSEEEEEPKPRKNNIEEEVKNYLSKNGIKLSFLIQREEIQMEREIGRGAFGKVWQGRWLGQDVAVKQYCKRVRNSHIGNFVEEVRLINRLLSPYIVLFMGMYMSNNQYALVTEFLQHGSLFDHLHAKGTVFDPQRLLSFAEDIVLGMIYLHGRSIFHCDLKSSNVLLDRSWNLKLCDFGLSRLKGKKCLGRIGTVNWMAPQIMRGEKFEAEADVYSFGMIVWEMLTGKVPYQSLSKTQIISLVGHENQVLLPTPPGPPILVTIFRLCYRRNPKERPSFQTLLSLIEKQKESKKKEQPTIFQNIYRRLFE